MRSWRRAMSSAQQSVKVARAVSCAECRASRSSSRSRTNRDQTPRNSTARAFSSSLVRFVIVCSSFQSRLPPRPDLHCEHAQSGGGRGITAECTLALAEKTGMKCALVGRSQADKEITANLARFAEKKIVAGSCCAICVRVVDRCLFPAEYFTCDVADLNDVARLISTVVAKLGQFLKSPRPLPRLDRESSHCV